MLVMSVIIMSDNVFLGLKAKIGVYGPKMKSFRETLEREIIMSVIILSDNACIERCCHGDRRLYVDIRNPGD